MFLHTILLTVIGISAVQPASIPLAIEMAQQRLDELQDILRDLEVSTQPHDCGDLYNIGQRRSGVFFIFPSGASSGVPVFCDMETDGGGWTVIQRRGQYENPVYYFYRNWTEYANGFGDPSKEYWIGNNALHSLTSNGREMSLRIELKNDTNGRLVASYSTFKVANESSQFAINVGGYTGPPGSDAFASTNGQKFTTFDRDNDKNPKNCAILFRGGWWYSNCHASNLNGLNLNGRHDSFADGIEWSRLNNSSGLHHYSYPEVEMKIRDFRFLAR